MSTKNGLIYRLDSDWIASYFSDDLANVDDATSRINQIWSDTADAVIAYLSENNIDAQVVDGDEATVEIEWLNAHGIDNVAGNLSVGEGITTSLKFSYRETVIASENVKISDDDIERFVVNYWESLEL